MYFDLFRKKVVCTGHYFVNFRLTSAADTASALYHLNHNLFQLDIDRQTSLIYQTINTIDFIAYNQITMLYLCLRCTQNNILSELLNSEYWLVFFASNPNIDLV